MSIFLRTFKVNKWNISTYRPFLSFSTVPEEQKIKVGKYDINYIKVGNGPHHLFCLPGTFGTIWADFKHQIEGIDRNKFTLVVWDPPGHGKSRPPEKEFDFDFFERDADYAYQFMKALKVETYSLLGWSAGGNVALIHAAKYSDFVRKLILCGCSPSILPQDLEAVKKMRYLSNWPKNYLDELINLYGEKVLAHLMSKWTDLIIEIYNVKGGNVSVDSLPNIKCPTYILHGENDQASNIKHVSNLHANITGSRFFIYPKGKHNIQMTYAEDFNKKIQHFLLE